MNPETRKRIDRFVPQALEAVVYVDPDDPRLHLSEMHELREALGIAGQGALDDWLDSRHNEHRTALRERTPLRMRETDATLRVDFDRVRPGDPVDIRALDFLVAHLQAVEDEQGRQHARVPLRSLLDAAMGQGLDEHDVKVAVALFAAAGELDLDGNDVVGGKILGRPLPSEARRATSNNAELNDSFAQVLNAVDAIRGGRARARTQSAEAVQADVTGPARKEFTEPSDARERPHRDSRQQPISRGNGDLRKLRRLLDEARGLVRSRSIGLLAFDAWRTKAENVLPNIYGDDHDNIGRVVTPHHETLLAEPEEEREERRLQTMKQALFQLRALAQVMDEALSDEEHEQAEMPGEHPRAATRFEGFGTQLEVAPPAAPWAGSANGENQNTKISANTEEAGLSGERPRVFIGSSAEALELAQTLQVGLDHCAEVTLWTQGVFQPSSGTLTSLICRCNSSDFAILVLTPDDLTDVRGETKTSPRDNVIFELGLFIGAIGDDRTFMVHSRSDPLDLPTDLAGITPVTFEPHADGNLQSALGAACTLIEKQIAKLGRRRAAGPRAADSA